MNTVLGMLPVPKDGSGSSCSKENERFSLIPNPPAPPTNFSAHGFSPPMDNPNTRPRSDRLVPQRAKATVVTCFELGTKERVCNGVYKIPMCPCVKKTRTRTHTKNGMQHTSVVKVRRFSPEPADGFVYDLLLAWIRISGVIATIPERSALWVGLHRVPRRCLCLLGLSHEVVNAFSWNAANNANKLTCNIFSRFRLLPMFRETIHWVDKAPEVGLRCPGRRVSPVDPWLVCLERKLPS